MRKSLRKSPLSVAETFEARLQREHDDFDKGTKAEKIYAEVWELSVIYNCLEKLSEVEAVIRKLLVDRSFADDVSFDRKNLKIEIILDGENYPFFQGETIVKED